MDNKLSHFLQGLESKWINVEAWYLPLYQVALKGAWKRAEMFIWDDPTALRARISILSMTALHVAVGQQHWNFVEHLVDCMAPVDLEMQDVGGYTALHYAAKAECFCAVKAMVRKNPMLVQIPSNSGHVPLHIAASSSTSPIQKKVVWYLAIVTKNESPHCPFSCPRGSELFWGVVAAEYFGIYKTVILYNLILLYFLKCLIPKLKIRHINCLTI